MLLNIVLQLKNDNESRDTKSLNEVMHVDRQLRRIATPFVYETFDMRRNNHFKFLRTLLEVPTLCQNVKYVSWGYERHLD
jgi:hypothetical protein